MPEDTLKDTDLQNPNYLTYMYNRVDGKMVSQVVDGATANELYKQGWRLSPACFSLDEQLKADPIFINAADEIAYVLNQLLNIDVIEDRAVLMHLANEFFKLDVKPKEFTKVIRKKIKLAAIERGMIEDVSGNQ